VISSATAAESRRLALADLPPAEQLRVLSAAIETFATHGYDGTTLAHLQTQIDPSVFDALFVDTEDCFLDVYVHLIAQATEVVTGAVSREAGWPERLAAGLCAVCELIEANPSAARLVLVESQIASAPVLGHFMYTIRSIAPFMSEGRALSEASLPPIVDTALIGGAAQILATHLQDHRAEPLTDLYRELLEVLLYPYLGVAGTKAFMASRPKGAPYA
jgi:hypothetical protein